MKTIATVFATLVALILLAAFVLWFSVTQPFVRKAAVNVPQNAFPPDELKKTVTAIASAPHDHAQVARLALIAADIHAHFATLPGGQIAEQTYVVQGSAYRNVGVLFGNAQERIVIGAHYDAQGPYPGADDDASGIAVVMQLARVVAAEKPAFLSRVGVELVAYSLEESPRFRGPEMGSARHAQAMVDAGVKVRAMMSLEMLGYYSDAPGSQKFPLPQLRWFYPSIGNGIVLVGKLGQGGIVRATKSAFFGASDLPVFSINAPRFVPGIDFSDHQSYWNRNFPALMVTDSAFYRNDNYHKASDLPETLDYDKMSKVAADVYAALGVLAN
jgi:Zn-dependent M28 family amino/carboxypeptidase